MCDFKWTKEPPTEPGFYWYRIRFGEEKKNPLTSLKGIVLTGVKRIENKNGELVVDNGGCLVPVEETERLWAGPIAEPKEQL